MSGLKTRYPQYQRLNKEIERIHSEIERLGISFYHSQPTSFNETTIDKLMSDISFLERSFNHHFNNANKEERAYLQNLKDLIKGARDVVDYNYMQAATNNLNHAISHHRVAINNHIENHSDSEIESLKNALEYINNGIADIESNWKNKHSWKNRARLGSKVESLRVIKREVHSRLQEAEQVEKELERMEAQIQQHSNQMEELTIERDIEAMRMQRQREAQADMESLMDKFNAIINGD